MSRVIVNSENRITQKFKPTSHKGVDLGYSSNEEKNKVYANSEGVVYEIKDNRVNNTKASGNASWGNYVLVKHPNGMFTRYAHLKTGIPVKVGDKVNDNTIIGIIGNTGRSYGRHLHFEVATGYSSTTRINPEAYLIKAVYSDHTPTSYIMIDTSSGVWCRKGIGFSYSKYKVIPNKTKCELVTKNIGVCNGYNWDKIKYNNEIVYVPNKWNKYL